MSETRKLAAIMFTDMVGFSRLMHSDEEKTLELLDVGERVIESAVADQQGRVLKKMGDAVLAEFSSAAGAVTAAIEIQTRLRDYNEHKPPAEQVVLRIGIHLGDIIIRDQDLFGDGINVAARLEPLSEPGGICLSEAVYQAISANASVKPILVGEVELKNIVQKQVVYRIPAFYGRPTLHEAPGSPPQKGLDFGAVERIERLPAPSRSPWAMGFVGVAIFALGTVVGVAGAFGNSEPYRIWRWEMVAPDSIIAALREPTTPEHSRVRESLDRDARAAVDAYDPAAGDARAEERTSRLVRLALNELLGSGRPVFERLDGRDTVDVPTDPEELRRLNRERLESAFPGGIQRYVGAPSAGRILSGTFRTLASSGPLLLVGFAGLLLALALVSAYSGSLRTLRIFFRDIRDVDRLLDFYIRDLGFKPPVEKDGDLVFRASWWTFALYGVLNLRARVSGSSVVLTGPTPMMGRLRKRMLSLAETEPARDSG